MPRISDLKIDYVIIGKRIRDARLFRNISIKELSELMNVSLVYISRVESGNKGLINLKRVFEFAHYLQVPVSYILDDASMYEQNYLAKDFSRIFQGLEPRTRQFLYTVAAEVEKRQHEDDGEE